MYNVAKVGAVQKWRHHFFLGILDFHPLSLNTFIIWQTPTP